MNAMASQITGVSIVYSNVSLDADQRKHLNVIGLFEGNPPVTTGFPYKGPITRETFPFDDVII